MMENDPVLIEIDAPLMRITLQRPHCLNALDRKSHFILAEAFDRFSKDSSPVSYTHLTLPTKA